MNPIDFDTFYFKHIDIENYDVIYQEIKNEILPFANSATRSGFFLLNERSFLANCPIISTWFNINQMILVQVAVHIAMPKIFVGSIHSDPILSEYSQLALNLNIENCDITKTKMFDATAHGKVCYTPGQNIPYIVYDHNSPNIKEITSYSITKPILVNIRKPHVVTNDTDVRRVSLSLRFQDYPLNLIK